VVGNYATADNRVDLQISAASAKSSSGEGNTHMPSVLVAYVTNAGSTEKVAQVIGEEIGKNGAQVEVCPLLAVTSVEPYDAVVIGAPMIMGWHGAAVKFLKRHQHDLSQKRVALFVTA